MASGTGNAGTVVSLAYNAEQIDAYITTVEAAVPWLAIIMFAVDILELAGIIPDPIALLIGAFTGRPREQATVEQAGRLMRARNPAARQAGIMLERMVKEWGIVTSVQGQGRQILDSWASLFVNNLTAQGISLDRARQILVHATSEAAQTDLPLEPELLQPLPDGLVFNGPQSMLDQLTQQYQNWIAKGVGIKSALQHAENYIFTKYGLRYLFQLQIGKYIPPNPPPQRVIPGQDGSCPAGYTLDPASEFCVLPSQGGNGGGGGGDGGTQPDPNGDEITNDLCAQMGAYTAQLAQALSGLNPGSGSGTDPECCANVVNALTNVTTALTSIATAVASAASGSGASVDLSGITAELNSLVAAVGSIPGGGAVDLSGVVTQLTRIADDLGSGSPTDVSQVVEQLKIANQLRDIPHDIIQQFLSDGVLPPEYSGILQGTPADWVHAALEAAAMFSPIIGFVEHILGDDKDFSAAIRKDREGLKAVIGKLMALGKDIPALPPEAGTDNIKALFTKFFTVSEATLGPLIKPVVDAIVGKLAGAGTPALGAYPVDPDGPIADATGAALGAAVAGWLAAYAGIDEGEPLAKMVEFMSGAIGFEELRDVKIGPLIREGIGQVAAMNARALFQQNIPGVGQAASLVSRGLLDKNTAQLLYGWNGLHTSLRAQVEAGAYTGINARMLLQVVQSGLVTQGDLADELTFSGVRPASQQRLLAVAPWIATRAERDQLKASLEKAYQQGLLDDAGLHAQLDQIQQETDRDALILARSQLEKRLAMAKALEGAYSTEFRAGVIVEAQYRSLLAGLGLQDDWINVKVAVDDAHMLATLARQAAAAERALERATQAEERKAAVKNFTAGHGDPVSLAAALLLTGLTATQAAAWVDLAVLQKAGGLRWIFGLQRSPEEAALLRQRVSALSDQRKRLQITDLAFQASLQALGIPAKYVNTIRAAADAMITPKASAVTIPVETG